MELRALYRRALRIYREKFPASIGKFQSSGYYLSQIKGTEQGADCRPQEEVNTVVFTLIFLLVVGWVVFHSIRVLRASISGKPGVIPEELDLNSVRDSLREKQGWSLERAEAARAEYIRFLTLLQMKPGFMLVPWPNEEGKDDLDQFWHQHILDTSKYAKDCSLLFGRMIHHNPHVVRGSGQEKDAVEKTQRLYERTFDSGTYGRPTNAALVTGCAACATVDSSSSGHGGHGSGHGDHGSGDGGHGGHSCGGHSCGHGCGHGCGGH